MSTYDYYVTSQIPCGHKGCNYDLFAMAIEDWSAVGHYRIVCLECNHMREISFENYELMKDISNYLEFTMMRHGVNWTKERIRKVMIGKKFAEDLK